MPNPVLLCFDCTSSFNHSELRAQCAPFFDLVRSVRIDRAAEEITRARPKVLCFDFDYPDEARLRAMQAIKSEHMRLPILMLTLEHSEALAVWAFRARVWNYLVKPVSAEEMRDNLRTLQQIIGAERRLTPAVPVPDPGPLSHVPASAPEDAQMLLLPAVYYIEQHFNERISAAEIASLCGMTRFRFSRLFHRAFGIRFQDYVTRFRIDAACRLLQRPTVSITEVGYAVGFNDASYFARMFRRYVGMLPSEYASSEPRPSTAHVRPTLLQSNSGVLARVRAQLPQQAASEDEALADIA